MDGAPIDILHRRFDDGSEQERALEGWAQRYVQTGSGRYDGEIRRLRLPGVAVTRETVRVGVEQRTAPPAGRCVFVQTLGPASDWRINAEPITADTACFIAGGEEFHASMPKGCDIVFVEYDGAENGPDAGCEGSLMPVAGGAEAGAIGVWLLSLVMSLPVLPEAGATDMAAFLPGMILDRLSHLRDARRGRPDRRSASRADWSIFRLVRDHVDAAGSDPLSVADLRRRLDLPEAVIRQAFVNTVGMGPGTWMRSHRLNGARRDLMDDAPASVSEIATRWGFWHLGRFSRYYADLFGEMPSQTRDGRREGAGR